MYVFRRFWRYIVSISNRKSGCFAQCSRKVAKTALLLFLLTPLLFFKKNNFFLVFGLVFQVFVLFLNEWYIFLPWSHLHAKVEQNNFKNGVSFKKLKLVSLYILRCEKMKKKQEKTSKKNMCFPQLNGSMVISFFVLFCCIRWRF